MVSTKAEVAKRLLLGDCDTCGWRARGSITDPTFKVWCIPGYGEPDQDRTLEKSASEIPPNRTCEHYKELMALREELNGTQKL